MASESQKFRKKQIFAETYEPAAQEGEHESK
jgi:hypothetical protein